jgi:hypothetical protein
MIELLKGCSRCCEHCSPSASSREALTNTRSLLLASRGAPCLDLRSRSACIRFSCAPGKESHPPDRVPVLQTTQFTFTPDVLPQSLSKRPRVMWRSPAALLVSCSRWGAAARVWDASRHAGAFSGCWPGVASPHDGTQRRNVPSLSELSFFWICLGHPGLDGLESISIIC